MNKKYWKYSVIIFLGGVLTLSFFYWWWKSCWNILEKNISWNSMEPLIFSWDKLSLNIGYYNCHDLERGDLIAYDFANSWELYIKILYGFPWDKIFFKNSKLFINNKVLINSIWKEYVFSKEEEKLISLYIFNWLLKKWSYLIFWDNISNSSDSRKFWWIWKKDIVGKFYFK